MFDFLGVLDLNPRLTPPFLQTPTPESLLTTIQDEPEVPVSGGPSGDFELQEETTQPDTANEVVAVGGAAAKPSPPPGTLPKDARPGPGLHDNTIDSGSSAAQLPQKSILERKEVLVGEARPQAWGRQGAGLLGRESRGFIPGPLLPFLSPSSFSPVESVLLSL